ncbi:MAG: Fic family protein [Candidatus Obscuribacterales bacterium]|nr:Fic family protein [Candidatus Obscuribacterales bacterium]
MSEHPSRIEPARLEFLPEKIADLVANLSSAGALLGSSLHPTTAASLASLVRIMNTYYSNLIEGHDTRPRDIERALVGNFDQDNMRRNLQLEAAAHVHVQEQIDRMAAENCLPDPASGDFIKWLHAEFYRDAPEEMLLIKSDHTEIKMLPGTWRSSPEHDVAVGRHIPPSSQNVIEFMQHFQARYDFSCMGMGAQIASIPAAHHRFNYIHPFPDGNGRVSRLISHSMALKAGIGAHGLWSVSRGLARGLKSRTEYKSMMDLADSPRAGDYDGRGNLSQSALIQFTEWFLAVCLDQVTFMSELFDLRNLEQRLVNYVHKSEKLKPESAYLLKEALRVGSFERGEAEGITKLSERSARRVLSDLIAEGLLASSTPKGPVSLRFPIQSLEMLFPKLYPES